MSKYFIEKPNCNPQIYAYSLPTVQDRKGYLKVGYTTRKNVDERIKEQINQLHVEYITELVVSAIKNDGTSFSDHDVHSILEKKYERINKTEWFKCDVNAVKNAINEIKLGIKVDDVDRINYFKMRPEQEKAVEKTINYFNKIAKTENQPGKFLWNCKMRFGKTFTSYQLAKRLECKKILILTFKPVVESSWKDDLMSHIDFDGWQFISDFSAKKNKHTIDYEFYECNRDKPIVVFGSFQNILGRNENGGIKAKNEFIHKEEWDLVIFDEYHYGAWRDNAKKLFSSYDEEDDFDLDIESYKKNEANNAYNESYLPIVTKRYLYLSGTPFRAINSGEFIEEQIYAWTYSDEQRAKKEFVGKDNPYLSLPKMILMTYQLPDSIKNIAINTEFNEFDLNIFFKAIGNGESARFIYENEVQKWLDLIRGAYLPSNIDDLKLSKDKKPPMPYSDTRLLNILTHTLWYLPDVASCEAMYNLIMQRHNSFYHQYHINLCAGKKAGIGLDALKPVKDSMVKDNKSWLDTKTITLTCGKLTTGVTIKPWTGVFMLRNLKSPETYFQAAFRAQSPWVIKLDSEEYEIIKHECFIFDFALDRALKQISDYACSLTTDGSNPEKKVNEFIQFLPVLAYDGSSMTEINAQEILDMTTSGTSATLLARRWESALLVNVDNCTLSKILGNKDALNALMSIEGFRALNQDIETIINKSEQIKKVKKENQQLSDKQKKELTTEEKEYKSKRKQIQEKLIKFATRIPVFMYLTDYRERCLKDVITQLEPDLFKSVTGLNIKDFELLCSLGVFNSNLMNDAIYKFKRYEDSSLSYTGIEKNNSEFVGGWDTIIHKKEHKKLFFFNEDSKKS